MNFHKYVTDVTEVALRMKGDFTEIKCGKTHIAIKKQLDKDGVSLNVTDLLINMSLKEAKELITAIQNAIKAKR